MSFALLEINSLAITLIFFEHYSVFSVFSLLIVDSIVQNRRGGLVNSSGSIVGYYTDILEWPLEIFVQTACNVYYGSSGPPETITRRGIMVQNTRFYILLYIIKISCNNSPNFCNKNMLIETYFTICPSYGF